jgi:hypothetical protein
MEGTNFADIPPPNLHCLLHHCQLHHCLHCGAVAWFIVCINVSCNIACVNVSCIIVCVAALLSALLSAAVSLSSALSSSAALRHGVVVCVLVRHLRCGVIVCVVVCGIVVCVIVICVVVVCIIVVCILIVCIAGVGGRVCFVLNLCGGGGRWCDIPTTWQMMARTYSDKRSNLANGIEEGRVPAANYYRQEGNVERWGSIGWIMEA